MKGIVVGVGILELTTSIALQKIGIQTTVYDAVLKIRTVGIGIWMGRIQMIFD